MDDWVQVILGISLGLGVIVLISFALQKIFDFFSNHLHPQKIEPKPEYPELSEKLRKNLGLELPDYKVDTLLYIPNSDDMIVLLHFSHAFKNLLRCHSDGSLVWQAEFPEIRIGWSEGMDDVYVAVELKNDRLWANSWSCYLVEIEADTGKVLQSFWTK